MSESEAVDLKVPAPRRRQSPGYPGVDLRAAIDRTVDLYKASPRQPVALTLAAEIWGFSPKSSSGATTAAALKRYGLVRDVGGGDGRLLELTEEGRELAFSNDERGTERWVSLVRDSALKPKIFRQVLDNFGLPLPDERVVLRHLMFDLGFADESAARDFLRKLKATIDFAGLDETVSSIGVGEAGEGDDRAVTPGTAHARPSVPTTDQVWVASSDGLPESSAPGRPPERTSYDAFRSDRKVVQIPYSNGQWAELAAAFPLTEGEWTMLMGVLEAMKPGLVRGSQEHASAEGDGPADTE